MERMTARAPVRVLVVHPQQLVRRGIKLLLELERTQPIAVVGEAAEAQSALRMLGALRPDLVLTEVPLAGGSGLDLIEPVRTHLPEARVLILTTVDDEAVVQEALRRGATGYLLAL